MRQSARPIPSALRRLLCAQVLGIYLATSWAPAAFAAPTIPPASLAQEPQSLPKPPAPNVVVTLDDSGSMVQAHVPDELGGSQGTRRYKSSAFNPLYYDPGTVYLPPLDAKGNPLATSFTRAWINGFADGLAGRPNNGSVNLATDYRPTLAYNPSSTSQDFAAHPNISADLDALQAGRVANGGTLVSPFKPDSPGPAYYYRFKATLPNCDGTVNDDDCYELVIVSATSGTNPAIGPDERQNFANWYSYYRTRNLLVATAASRAFAALPDSVRLAWQGLTTCDSFGTSCTGWGGGAVENRIRRFADDPLTVNHRSAFYSWLFRLPASGFTPLRSAMMRAGEYYRSSGVNSPYAQDPQISLGTEYSCRRNYHILMTDGFWNSDKDTTGSFCSGAACGNADSAARTLPDGTVFPSTPSDPDFALASIYRDANADSLADVAFHYWATDLRPDLPNNQASYYADRTGSAAAQYWNPRNDPATWQHMTNFTVGLGLTANMTLPGLTWGGDTFAGTGFDNLLTGVESWPSTGAPSTWLAGSTTAAAAQGRVYDLWHAAINSRGLAFSAERSSDLIAGFSRIVREIVGERASSGSAATATTAFLDVGNGVFTTEYTQGTWTGNLYRREIDPATLQFRSFGGNAWQWRASDQLPAPNARRIFTLRPDGSRVEFVPESGSTGVSSSQMAELSSNPSASAADVIDYLRGDRSKERSAVPPGNLRDRPRGANSNVLGSIVNSSPLYVKDDDFALDLLPTGTPGRDTYQAFVRANAGVGGGPGRTPLVWVGSNGGMFHAFNADTGAEVFAYVPRSVIRNLPELTKPDYVHRYFVDGVPASGDAYIAPNGIGSPSWRTVVIGSLGAGGRSVFAIDATDPATLGANSILWDLDETSLSSSSYQYLGHVFGPAFTARAKNGKWVAVFGNGPESDNKRAALFIVDLETGNPIRIIDTGDGDNSKPNGLSTPAPAFDANQQLIGVYAGDLRGNLWKFDLSSTDAASWNVALGGQPLFKARNPAGQRQPIFARPLLRRHPNGGAMVIFGTGKLFSPGDKENADIQTLYGVWDKPSAVPLSDNFRSGTDMVQQAITQKDVFDPSIAGDEPTNYRLTNFPVNYGAGKRGWYLDLGVQYSVAGSAVNTASAQVVTPRERMVVSPIQLGGNLLAQSFIPSTDPCSPGGDSFLYRLDPLTGSFIGARSFGDPDSGAIQIPGSFGMLPFYSRTGASVPPPGGGGTQPPPPPPCPPGATCTCPAGFDYIFSTGIDGSISGRCVPRGGIGAVRTWRQIIQ